MYCIKLYLNIKTNFSLLAKITLDNMITFISSNRTILRCDTACIGHLPHFYVQYQILIEQTLLNVHMLSSFNYSSQLAAVSILSFFILCSYAVFRSRLWRSHSFDQATHKLCQSYIVMPNFRNNAHSCFISHLW